MQLEFIGTGDCAGIPVYGCTCSICRESLQKTELKRGSSCARISSSSQTILIDAGLAEIGQRFPRHTLDRILLSHYHIDHVYGLFPMRWGCCDTPLLVHGPEDPEGCADLLKHHGILDFSDYLKPFATRIFVDLEVTPLPLNHSKPSLGYALATEDSRLAWLCDTGGLPPETITFLKNWQPDIMVLDCTFAPLAEPHPNHNDITMALSLHEEIRPGRTYLTHINHQLAFWLETNDKKLPKNVQVAQDDLIVTF